MSQETGKSIHVYYRYCPHGSAGFHSHKVYSTSGSIWSVIQIGLGGSPTGDQTMQILCARWDHNPDLPEEWHEMRSDRRDAWPYIYVDDPYMPLAWTSPLEQNANEAEEIAYRRLCGPDSEETVSDAVQQSTGRWSPRVGTGSHATMLPGTYATREEAIEAARATQSV